MSEAQGSGVFQGSGSDAPVSESETMLRMALDSAGLGWWHIDLATGAISWNERLGVLAGLPEGQALDYENALKLVHPDDVERLDAAVKAATRLVDPEPYALDYRTRHADGTYHWVQSRGQTYYEGEGESRRATRFVGTVADIDDRKRADEALRSSEERYRTLVNSIDAGFCVLRVKLDEAGIGVDYQFLEVNPAFENQTGLTNATGKMIGDLVPEIEPHWPRMYGEVATTGKPVRFSQGAESMGRFFDVYAFRLGGDESRDVAVLFYEISAQREYEASLLLANERTTNILESITDAFFALDREWRFTYTNKQAERILEQEPGALLGQSMWEAYPGLIGTRFETVYRAAGEGIPGRLTEFYPDHNRWYEVHAFPAAEGITVYFRDASEHVTNEQDRERLLQEVEAERLKLEFAHAGSYSFVAILKGRDMVFEFANEPYFELVGRREIIGKSVAEALPEVVEPGFVGLLLEVMDTGVPFEAIEIPVELQRDAAGPPEERILSLRYLPMRESDGTITGIYAHGIDVTEMVHARRTLSARAEETALGSRRKDEFLATLAHELRNPLAPIRLSTELMEMLDPSDPDFKEAQTVIRRQVDHMVRLVDDLLDVSRVAQGKIKLRREPVELTKVMTAAVETSRPLIEAGDHSFTVSNASEPIYVHGDATRLAQVVANLLNNSAKYTPAGGQISLEVAKEDEHAVIRVRDSGIGISAEMLPHIFDMFAQAPAQMSQSQGGLGIGLTLSRRLMEKHGGSIEARSAGAGQGSEFIVRLPAIAPPVRREVPTPVVSAPASTCRVLVVDDNVDNAWTLSGLLQSMGHEVQIAHSGEEAISVAEGFQPQIVLLDLGLPDIPGYEVARRLRANPRLGKAYIVAQTGWGREEDRALGREAGFDEHLVKPLARTDLDRLFSKLS